MAAESETNARAGSQVETRPVADPVLRHIEPFLFRRARLLDERRYDEWVAFTDDVHDWMPVR